MSDEPKPPPKPADSQTMSLRACDAALAEAQTMGAAHVIVAVVGSDGSYHWRAIGSPFVIRALAEWTDAQAKETYPLITTIAAKKE